MKQGSEQIFLLYVFKPWTLNLSKNVLKARKSPEKDYSQEDVSARSHWLMVSGASCVKGVMGSDTSAHALWATQRRSEFKNTIILRASGEQL